MSSQPLEALLVADRVRVDRGVVRRELREGVLSPGVAVWDVRAGVLTVEKFVRAVPGRDRRAVERVCVAAGCSPWRRLRELTDRQLGVIAETLDPVTPSGTKRCSGEGTGC